MLRELLTATDPAPSIAHPGVRILGARISGLLDLTGLTVPFPLAFIRCSFERAPILRGADLAALSLGGSRLPGLAAQCLRIRYDLQLADGFRSDGLVCLDSANVLRQSFVQRRDHHGRLTRAH